MPARPARRWWFVETSGFTKVCPIDYACTGLSFFFFFPLDLLAPKCIACTLLLGLDTCWARSTYSVSISTDSPIAATIDRGYEANPTYSTVNGPPMIEGICSQIRSIFGITSQVINHCSHF